MYIKIHQKEVVSYTTKENIVITFVVHRKEIHIQSLPIMILLLFETQ